MKRIFIPKNPLARNVLAALFVAGVGYLLLNLAFLVDFLFWRLILLIAQPFTPADLMGTVAWFPYVLHFSFLGLIGLASWFVFRSKLNILMKATYLTVPVAAGLVTVGMLLHRWPVAAFSLATLLCAGTLYFLYRTKQSWLYLYSVLLVGVTLGIFTALGGEI